MIDKIKNFFVTVGVYSIIVLMFLLAIGVIAGIFYLSRVRFVW